MMFTDSQSWSSSFHSSWQQTVSSSSSSTQTDALSSFPKATQSHTMVDAEMQTEMSTEMSESQKEQLLNSDKLRHFLKDAVAIIEEELEMAAATTSAFDDYTRRFEDYEDKGRFKGAKRLHTLSLGSSFSSSSSLVAIHPRLSLVAVGGGEHHVHSSWCDHTSSLGIWSLNSGQFDPQQPAVMLDSLPSCISHLLFNPYELEHQTCLAVAHHTGEITLYTLDMTQSKVDVMASNALSKVLHRERVTSMKWLAPKKLLSTALDGWIIVWTIRGSGKKLQLVASRTFVITSDHLILVGEKGTRALKMGKKREIDVGITCMDVNREDDDEVVLGTESGTLLQCYLSSEKPLATMETSMDAVYDPVHQSLVGHRGRVLSLQCSPIDREVFASTGSDGEVQLHSLLQPQSPLRILLISSTPVIDLNWNLNFLVVLDAVKGLFVIDSEKDRRLNIRDNEAHDDDVVFTNLDSNNVGNRLLLADNNGRVQLWRFDTNLLLTNK